MTCCGNKTHLYQIRPKDIWALEDSSQYIGLSIGYDALKLDTIELSIDSQCERLKNWLNRIHQWGVTVHYDQTLKEGIAAASRQATSHRADLKGLRQVVFRYASNQNTITFEDKQADTAQDDGSALSDANLAEARAETNEIQSLSGPNRVPGDKDLSKMSTINQSSSDKYREPQASAISETAESNDQAPLSSTNGNTMNIHQTANPVDGQFHSRPASKIPKTYGLRSRKKVNPSAKLLVKSSNKNDWRRRRYRRVPWRLNRPRPRKGEDTDCGLENHPVKVAHEMLWGYS